MFFDGENVGVIDENLNAFKRKSDGSLFPPALIKGEPPGNWWIKPKTGVGVPQKAESVKILGQD